MALNSSIFRQEAKFIAGAARVEQFPKLFLPQIAFIGKSNVGKSSLINSVCKKKSLARVSHTPGRTQQINFFSIADKIIISDLPGYGFAKVSKNLQIVWERIITHYLENSENLKLVNLLIDSRRGIKENDIEIMNLLSEFERNFQIVFTKADKIKNHDDFKEETMQHLKALGHACEFILTSSKNALGVRELQGSMCSL